MAVMGKDSSTSSLTDPQLHWLFKKADLSSNAFLVSSSYSGDCLCIFRVFLPLIEMTKEIVKSDCANIAKRKKRITIDSV
ncbi:unnamed protein product [Nezara viridula]|uniref:Uncharacterized protein n=1 Tax=Nezara viridula TaxID=85310 RepID=A0A9P0MHG6_NEZVI|nr:unnamed protein product [Nezara viridula]